MERGVNLISGWAPILLISLVDICKNGCSQPGGLGVGTASPFVSQQVSPLVSSEGSKAMRRDEHTLERHNRDTETSNDLDAEFGGTEARKKLEKRLLLKLDARMFILIVIYILNYVSFTV